MQSEKRDKKARAAGVVTTIAVNACILLICIFSGLKYQYPQPEESGILMEMEADPISEPQIIETSAGIEPRVENPDPDEDIKLVQRSEAQHKGEKANIAEVATVGKDGDVEVNEPEREEVIDKRALFPSAANSKKVDTLAAQVADKVSSSLKAGHPNGNTNIGSTDGEPSARLAGRSVMGSLPIPSYSVQKAGKVVVRITVDRNGNVTTAIPGDKGTTVSDRTLWESAKKAALDAHFNVSTGAPASQQGTITYIFKLH